MTPTNLLSIIQVDIRRDRCEFRPMPRILMLLSFASMLISCSDTSRDRASAPQSAKHDSISDTDRYVQALRAMMNARSCASPAGRGANWRPTEHERNALIRAIEELEASLKTAEAAAAAKGFGEYLAAARESLAMRMAEELHAACVPDEPEALRNARTAIADFHDQIAETKPASGHADNRG